MTTYSPNGIYLKHDYSDYQPLTCHTWNLGDTG